MASYQDDVPGERASGVVQDHLRWTDEAGTLGWTREGPIHGDANGVELELEPSDHYDRMCYETDITNG